VREKSGRHVQVRRHKQLKWKLESGWSSRVHAFRALELPRSGTAVSCIASDEPETLKFAFLAPTSTPYRLSSDCTVVAGLVITNSIQHHEPTTWPPPTPRSSMRNHSYCNAPNPQANQITENSWASLAASSRTSHTHPDTPNTRLQLTNDLVNTSSPSSKPTNSPPAPSRSSRRPCATTLRS
jgi:hypothetical protein